MKLYCPLTGAEVARETARTTAAFCRSPRRLAQAIRATLNAHACMKAPFCFLLLAAAASLFAQVNPQSSTETRLSQRIDKLRQQFPAINRGNLGYKFVDVLTGLVLAESEGDHFFTPASNTKLYTTALALNRLGPDYRFQTNLETTTAWAPGQTTLQDLQLVGGGDPNLSGRAIPYQLNAPDSDPFAALRDLAAQLAAKGVQQINGNVTGVSTRYLKEPYPDGWTVDDTIYGYGAPVSALVVNDSIVSLKVEATEPGELASVELKPSIRNFAVLNRILTDGSRTCKVQVSRPPGSNELILWGTIGRHSPAWEQDVAVEDPALFAAQAMIEVLRDAGITVRGEPRSQYTVPESSNAERAASGTVLATHQSALLSQIIQVVNKVSQNLHAEMLLREVAFVRQGNGSLECGVKERETFLSEIGITKDGSGFALYDGSGLARQDLTTPDSTVALLRSMWASPNRLAWLDSLPIGGVDGSLEHRFGQIHHADRIRAKTGSLSHVNALSGYIETSRHRWIAFSVMANATPNHAQDVQSFLDNLPALFLNE